MKIVLAAVVAVVLLLAAIEVITGVAMRWRSPSARAPSSAFTSDGTVRTPSAYTGSNVNLTPLQTDLGLLWRNQPGAERTQPVSPARFRRAAVWTTHINSDGFRGRERTHDRQDDELYRILCVGDSVTYGFNVSQNADYPAKLQRKLAEKYPDLRFEVINAGVPGWSWVQGAAFLLRGGLALRPDLVIVAHGTDDQLWPANVTDSEQMWLLSQPLVRTWESLNIFAQRTSAYRLLRSWMGNLSAVVSSSPGCQQQLADGGACRRVSLPEIEATVHRLHETARAAGVDLLLLNLDFFGTPAVGALRRAVKRDKLHFWDSVGRFRFERLEKQNKRARNLGLAPVRVPLVRPGTIGLPPPTGRGARMRFRVLKTVEGAELRIRGTGSPDPGFSLDEKLYDDGTHGDEEAGDGVFSVMVETPPSVSTLRYRFFLDDAPEFRDSPSTRSTNGDRVLQFNRDGDAPIELFGTRYRMTEEFHPDARGHARIAGDVLREIERIPSFRRFAGLPMDEPAQAAVAKQSPAASGLGEPVSSR